jgi:thrombospondin motif-containing protein 7/thrombospondin motif-containing protein 12
VRVVKRTTSSEHRYLEVLAVADKRFLEYHNNTDVETYILTVMNMASDFYHDASAGNLIDIVVVRIIYVYKEEEEMDLQINQDP